MEGRGCGGGGGGCPPVYKWKEEDVEEVEEEGDVTEEKFRSFS